MTRTAQYRELHGRRTAAGLGFAVALLLGTATTRAQEAVLDRPIGADHLGVAVVWAPEAIAHGLWARRIAQAARVPVVFEVAAPMPFTGLPERVNLTGLTVREALDALVGRDPRYTWRQVGETVVIRPTPAWDDASHPLHRRAGEEAAGDQPLAEAVRQVVGGDVASPNVASLAAIVDAGKRVGRRPGPRPTALARSSDLAAVGDLFVFVRDPRITRGSYVDVATWDGRSYPIQASASAEEAGR
jgi:hypothetical protein